MQPPRRPHALRHLPRHLGVAAACALGLPAWAQLADAGAGADAGRAAALVPSFTAEESYLETRGRLTGDNGREAITRLSPGLRLTSRSGRVQGSLDYVGSLLYRRGHAESTGTDYENTLNAAFLAEAVTNHAYVDARATVSQQAISAFGLQTADGGLQGNANRTEVSTVSLSPYVRGSIGGYVDYEARVSAGATSAKDSAAADSNTSGASFLLRSSTGAALFGWTLSATQARSEFKGSAAGTTDDSRVNAGLVISPAPEVRLTVNGGRESVDDGAGADRRDLNTSGISLQWQPSPRTSLSMELEERYFGRTHRVSFLHRSPRTIWSYSYTRDLVGGTDAATLGRPMTLYQLFSAQAASAYPDPAERDKFVRDLLTAQGLDPNQLVSVGFLASQASLQRRQDASIAWRGQRTTLTVTGFTTALSSITTVAGTDPVLGEAVREHGYASTLSYQLTPQSAVVLGGSRRMTFGTSTEVGNDLKSATISFTSQLGPRTSAQLGARYTVFNSPTEPYRETSLSASISLRF